MTTIRIDADTRAGDLTPFLVVWTLDAASLDARAVAGLLDKACAEAAAGEGGPADAAVEAYKTALTTLGRNPNRYRISSDALLRRCRKDGVVPSILPLVDLNNVLSMRTGWPIGCYDADLLDGEVVFRQGREGETMATLGKGDMDVAKLPLLADAGGPFGSTISDSVRSRVTEATRAPLFVLYGYGPVDAAVLTGLVGQVCREAGGVFGETPRLIAL
jgi:DNA/RNA-binding domain of Phe-tRNA-synthetase-like protein